MSQAVINILKDFGLGFAIAIGFGILFQTPKKVLWVAGLLGGFGHILRYVLMNYSGSGIISATLLAAIFIGLLGLYMAHRVHTPPDVFTIPACITMIPGLFAYRTMMGMIQIADEQSTQNNIQTLVNTAYNFVITSSLLFDLAIGISIGALLFRKKSAKTISFSRKRKHRKNN